MLQNIQTATGLSILIHDIIILYHSQMRRHVIVNPLYNDSVFVPK